MTVLHKALHDPASICFFIPDSYSVPPPSLSSIPLMFCFSNAVVLKVWSLVQQQLQHLKLVRRANYPDRLNRNPGTGLAVCGLASPPRDSAACSSGRPNDLAQRLISTSGPLHLLLLFSLTKILSPRILMLLNAYHSSLTSVDTSSHKPSLNT